MSGGSTVDNLLHQTINNFRSEITTIDPTEIAGEDSENSPVIPDSINYEDKPSIDGENGDNEEADEPDYVVTLEQVIDQVYEQGKLNVNTDGRTYGRTSICVGSVSLYIHIIRNVITYVYRNETIKNN